MNTPIYFAIKVIVLLAFIGLKLNAQDASEKYSEDADQNMFFEFRSPETLLNHFPGSVPVTDASINLNPGIDPDGDEQGTSCFTLDGERILTTNGLTNNVTVFDWESQEVITNVEVGAYPVHVDVSEEYAVVACLNDSSMYVIDLADYSISAILEMPGQTISCTVSEDGTKVYGHCFNQAHSTVEVYSLEDFSLLLTMDNLPALPYLVSWVTGSGRTSYVFFTFRLSPANNFLITPDGVNNLHFYDLTTGDLVTELQGIGECYEIELSLDENTLVSITTANPGTLYQVDVPSQTITDDFSLSIGYWAGSLSANADGNRAFFGGDNSGHIIDFSDDTHEIFATNTAFSSATTSDRQYVYSSNFKASVLDFENKSIVGIHQGNTQGTCCVSPIGYKAFVYNNLFWEGGFFYDFSSLNSLDYVGWAFFGNPPEGDIPSRVAITPDGSKAVVTNPGSWTVSIVDLNSNTVSSVLDVEEASRFIVVTNDGNWAIASGYDMNAIKVIDLNTEEIVAFVTTNQRPGNMVVSPDDDYVYVANIKGNSISKVLLDGANSIEVADYPCGTIGGVYSAYGIYTNLAITPDGAYLIVPISFENHVKVIDTETMTSVATLSTGNMPLQVAMNGSGDYVTVTNISDDTYSVIHVDGVNSSVIATHSNGLGNPIRVKYNPVLDQMTIVDYQQVNNQWKVLHTDPTTGDLITTEIHQGFGATLDVGYHETGTPVILTGAQPLPNGDYGDAHVLMGDLAYAIAPGPIAFDVNPATNTAVVACGGGGPDYISIVSLGDPLYPAVGTDPSQFVFEVDSGETAAELMVLTNSGEGTLNYSIEVLYPGKDPVEEDWLSINPTSGNLEPGEEQNILVTADSDGLDPDTYAGVIAISSNDPVNPVWEVPVEMIVSTVVGTSESPYSRIQISPNPFTDGFMVETLEPVLSVRVISTNGKVLYDQKVGSKRHFIPLDATHPGVYFLEINYLDGRRWVEKVVRQ